MTAWGSGQATAANGARVIFLFVWPSLPALVVAPAAVVLVRPFLISISQPPGCAAPTPVGVLFVTVRACARVARLPVCRRILTQLATAKAGLVLVNINPAYRPMELQYCLKKVRAILCPVLLMPIRVSGKKLR